MISHNSSYSSVAGRPGRLPTRMSDMAIVTLLGKGARPVCAFSNGVSQGTSAGKSSRVHLDCHHCKCKNVPFLCHGTPSQDLRCRPCYRVYTRILKKRSQDVPMSGDCQPKAREAGMAVLVDQNVFLPIHRDQFLAPRRTANRMTYTIQIPMNHTVSEGSKGRLPPPTAA